MNTELEPYLREDASQPPPAQKGIVLDHHQCPICYVKFDKAQGLRMHMIRKHRPGFSTKKRKISAKGLAAIRKSQAARRKREKQLKNGTNPGVDTIGEAANAILLTAQVLRSVSLGLKL